MSVGMKLMLFFICMSACPAYSRIYTLNEILDIGMKNSPALRIIEKEMYKSESDVQIITGSALPSIDASFNLSHDFSSKQSPDYYSSNNLVNQVVNSVSEMMRTKETVTSLGLGIRQPLFAQGKVYFGLKLANKKRVTLNCKIQDEKQKVRGSLVKLYFSSLTAQRNRNITFESLKIATETHRIVTLRQSIGTASVYDTLSSRLHCKNAEIAYTNSESDLRLSYDKLLIAAGIEEPLSSFELQDTVPVKEFTLDINEVVEAVLKENYSITQLSGYREIQNYQIKLAMSDFMPSIFCGATFSEIGQFDGPDDIGNLIWNDDRKVFIGAKWDLFTGTIRKEKVHQAYLDRDIFELNARQTIDNLLVETRRAYEIFVTAGNQLEASEEVVSLAENGLEIVKASYEAGSQIYLDMQNAELEYQKAKVQHNNAMYQYYCAIVDLQILMGNLLF